MCTSAINVVQVVTTVVGHGADGADDRDAGACRTPRAVEQLCREKVRECDHGKCAARMCVEWVMWLSPVALLLHLAERDGAMLREHRERSVRISALGAEVQLACLAEGGSKVLRMVSAVDLRRARGVAHSLVRRCLQARQLCHTPRPEARRKHVHVSSTFQRLARARAPFMYA
jgi:hypothetical protein